MCTAATYKTNDFYFGRTLDYEFTYGESIVVLPRNYPVDFRFSGRTAAHSAIIGTAHIKNGYPLFYDAANEYGLCAAGLNFMGNARYAENLKDNAVNVAAYEFILHILINCKTTDEVCEMCKNINVTDTPFDSELPTAQLHWMAADKNKCITAEITDGVIKIYDNPVGVLTNNPPFDYQMFALNNYMSVGAATPENHFSNKINLQKYSRGMGGIGLPGDVSSQSRFVRAAFTKLNSVSDGTNAQSVNQFFNILGNVKQVKGCCLLENGKYEYTVYTVCYNADRGIYYYTTYENPNPAVIDMHDFDLDGKTPYVFKMDNTPQPNFITPNKNDRKNV